MYEAPLQELSLAGNMLTELPDSLGSLTHLQKLQISGNRLTHLPASIGNLDRLEVCLSLTLQPSHRPRHMMVPSIPAPSPDVAVHKALKSHSPHDCKTHRSIISRKLWKKSQ